MVSKRHSAGASAAYCERTDRSNILAARNVVVTVEEIVDDLKAPSPNSTILPYWTIDAIVKAPGGALPSYTHGYYRRDNAFYSAWDGISRGRETFLGWMQEHVLHSNVSN